MKNKLDPIGVLSESIIKYIKEALSSASFDKTQKGIITETLSDNRYKVKIAQAAYTVPAVISGSYAVGDEVYVIVPQNDPDQMFLLPVGISELDPSTNRPVGQRKNWLCEPRDSRYSKPEHRAE